MGDFLIKAIQIAVDAHKGQEDKSGMPYLGHVLRVMESGLTVDEKIVGVLHDIVEDTNWTFDQLLQEGFSCSVVDAIRCVTKVDDDEPYDEFIERVKSNPLAVRVKINDLIDNMDMRRLSSLSDKDLKRLQKYHTAYIELTRMELW